MRCSTGLRAGKNRSNANMNPCQSATCIIVQVALEGQAADYDAEFACCLRRNVSDAISIQVERIGALVGRLGGALPEALS
jgi:hypothetical protein